MTPKEIAEYFGYYKFSKEIWKVSGRFGFQIRPSIVRPLPLEHGRIAKKSKGHIRIEPTGFIEILYGFSRIVITYNGNSVDEVFKRNLLDPKTNEYYTDALPF